MAILFTPYFRATDQSNAPIPGAFLGFYATSTSTLQPIYADFPLSIALSNPIRADGNGVFPAIWLDDSLPPYKIVLQYPDVNNPNVPGAIVAGPNGTLDPYNGPLPAGALAKLLNPQTPAEIAAAIVPTNYAYLPLNPWRYGADGTGGANDALAYTRVLAIQQQIDGTALWINGASEGVYPPSQEEITAQVSLKSYEFPPDSAFALNVFRFFTTAQITAILAGANTLDVSGAIQAANDFLEGRAPGAIGSLGTITPGSAYTNGTYTFVPLTGGAGLYAHANVTVAGGVVSSVVLTNPGNGYGVGNTLSAAAANIGGTGSGFSIPVASLATGGKQKTNGGALYFPAGYYYCGSTGLRVGGNVRWIGCQYEATTLNWNAAFAGNCVTLGPDLNGVYGYSGLYTMGTVMESFRINVPAAAAWGILANGIQQGSHLKDLKLTNVVNGGISITDTAGSAYFKMSDIYVIGAPVMSLSSIAIKCALQSTIELNQISLNGGGAANVASGCFSIGLQIISGGHIISDYQCEECITGLDISASAGEYPQIIDRMLCTNTSVGTPRAIWIHNGFTGHILARGVTAGAGITALQNDNTSYATLSGSTTVVPSYLWSGTLADISIHEGVIVSGVRSAITYVSGGTMRPDVSQGSSHLINVTTTNAFTVGAPLYSGAAMPGTLIGRRISLMIRNGGAGTMGAISWDSVYKMSAWTNPANNNSRCLDFEWNGTNWIQVAQTGADIPN